MMHRIRRDSRMNVIRAMQGSFRNVLCRDGRLDRFAVRRSGRLSVLHVQLMFGLQPVLRIPAIRPPGFFPNLMGPMGDIFVTDCGG
jgi:hypothetical protein